MVQTSTEETGMTDATTFSTLSPYTVIYALEGSEHWQYFECHADDPNHAEEQCQSFDPTALVLVALKGHGPDVKRLAAYMARWWRRQVGDE